jgi:hypothetical protein
MAINMIIPLVVLAELDAGIAITRKISKYQDASAICVRYVG